MKNRARQSESVESDTRRNVKIERKTDCQKETEILEEDLRIRQRWREQIDRRRRKKRRRKDEKKEKKNRVPKRN